MTLTLLNEWLEKQSPAMLEAKRRGLVPGIGNIPIVGLDLKM